MDNIDKVMLTDKPIGDYALLSDCRSAGLVARDGSVDWLSFPRFDSPSVFGRLLGMEAGSWRIAPTDEAEVSRRYLEGSMILETTFRTREGSLRLTDLLAVGENDTGHALGARAPHALAGAVSRAGRRRRASELFELAASFRNDVDLLAEEVDHRTGELLGNFPQAFSHIGLVGAAWAIREAEQGRPQRRDEPL